MKLSLGRNHTPLRVAFSSPIPRTVRGQVLCLVALIIGAKGAGYVLGITSPVTDSALSLLTQWIPVWLLGVVMLGICGFAWFSAYCHHGRDRYGFDALTGLAAGFASVYLVSALQGTTAEVAAVLMWVTGSTGAALLASFYRGRYRPFVQVLVAASALISAVLLAAIVEVSGAGVQGFLTWLAIAVLTVFLRGLRDVRDQPTRSDP